MPVDIAALRQDPAFQRLWVYNRAEADRVIAAAEAENAGATYTPPPPPPSRAATPRTATFGRPVMPEVARRAKLSDQAEAIMRAGQEMMNLYNSRIKPKIESGQLSSMGQGLEYTYPGITRHLGSFGFHDADPDVEDFITKSGQFATMVNAYYSGSAGGRGGVQAYEVITQPHIPHPPSGLRELLTGNWDLQKQGEQLPTILNNVELEEHKRGVQSYPALPTTKKDPVAELMKSYGISGAP